MLLRKYNSFFCRNFGTQLTAVRAENRLRRSLRYRPSMGNKLGLKREVVEAKKIRVTCPRITELFAIF